jgi:hypothetical protein
LGIVVTTSRSTRAVAPWKAVTRNVTGVEGSVPSSSVSPSDAGILSESSLPSFSKVLK